MISFRKEMESDFMNIQYSELYNAITDYAEKYGAHKFNDDENHAEYMKLVDICVKCGLIPECNREEFSTHGRLSAAIAYESNRIMFCQ